MQRHKENVFLEKFSLLNSQEHTDDIKWSSSSSSDYENASCKDKSCSLAKSNTRKRKRKKKLPKNTSNLDITIIDASKDYKKDICREKSPILTTKGTKTTIVQSPSSPILSSCRFPPRTPRSPILSQKSLHLTSPILTLKSGSPKYSNKVRKKLYNEQEKCKTHSSYQFKEKKIDSIKIGTDSESQIEIHGGNLENGHLGEKLALNSIKTLDESKSSSKAKLDLMNKVKNYFDSNFSSESTSQNISDTPTPEEYVNKNEEIEILSCKTQSASSIQPMKHESFISNSDSSNYFEKNTKKIKYKKGGLAYRLNALLKKQNANVSLWQHERFLAENSNFVIPKGEYLLFYNKKIDFRYGCYLVEAVDVKNEKYYIFINTLYVNNNITTESVFKLYVPYRILESDKDYKIIVNVCKFECINLKKY